MSAELLAAMKAYVEGPDGYSPTSVTPFSFDWSEVRPFFEEAQQNDVPSIGRETLAFFAIREQELLDADERRYLDELVERGRSPSKTPTDEEFYASHGQELRDEPRLKALWDRFIFGQEVQCTDFLEGLMRCLRRLRPTVASPGTKSVLVIDGVERAPAYFLPLNDEVCRYFSLRYKGLQTTLHGHVDFRSVEAFRYPEFASEIRGYARRTPDAAGRRARQLKFNVWVEARRPDGSTARGAVLRLVWEGDLNGVGGGLDSDLRRLTNNRKNTPLLRCTAGRRRSGTRARSEGLSLSDLSTLEPASQRDRGSFVPADARSESLKVAWHSSLARLQRERLLDPTIASQLQEGFDKFEADYGQALCDVRDLGQGAESLQHQAESYGQLLSQIVDRVHAPLALEELLRPLLEIGVAHVKGTSGSKPMAVVCPWHPLRLAVQHGRVKRLVKALADLLGAEPPTFTDDGALYFSEFARFLSDSGRPDVVLGWNSSESVILSHVDTLRDYSLHEPPVTNGRSSGATNENALPTARQVADLARRYLQLQPHEKDNLSIMLYNCDSAALPHAVVDSIRAEADRDGAEAMCQVILRHTDEARLRNLYQQLVTRELADDGLHASETTRDFMSRLRISLMVNQYAQSAQGGPPLDIVFCQDVISRNARLAWTSVPTFVRASEDIDPEQWSRRQPVGPGEPDALVYLVCPAQPMEGWAYLGAIAALCEPEQAKAARQSAQCLIPSRRTDTRSPATRTVIEETHRLGNWVVNFDDLLDRRQLLNTSIRVIRYKHSGTGGRNLVISSRASDSLLRATLRSRMRTLNLGLDASAIEELCERLINDANEVSGDIVLRAARRGTNANELIGVVLSRFLVQAELGHGRPAAWLFLDDYAAWLGQDERRIADILCLSPFADENGEPCLDVIVTEAKYVGASYAVRKAQDSAHQLRDTLKRLEAALVPEGAPPADQAIWLARLSDMLLDGMRETSEVGVRDSTFWRTTFRQGGCRIRLRGYSHVFAHGVGDQNANGPEDAFIGVQQTTTGFQERYSTSTLRELVRIYAERGDPLPIRERLAGRGFFRPPPPGEPDGGAPMDPSGNAPDGSGDFTNPDHFALAAPEDAEEFAIPPASDSAAPAGSSSPRSHFWELIEGASTISRESTEAAAWLDETASRCRTALLRYGMTAKLEQQILTPNAALLKFQGSDDLTVAKVESKVSELETSHGLKVLAVRAEPGRVAVTVVRPKRDLLMLDQVWREWQAISGAEANAKLLIGIKEDDGSQLFLEPEVAPHTLVAGSTGSGKSVLVQNIILGIAATNTPRQARIILVDPKAGVDYFAFEELPHLDGGIIDRPEDALRRLNELVEEMERRYALFRENKAKDVRIYNRRATEPLPLIWLVHDEFADWMQLPEYREAVEVAVSRLGVKARAAGIYLVFAAQRPDNTVFPMQLRSNLGNRLVLRVDSAGTSDLSLGIRNGGAEKLLGRGHLAAILGGGTEPIYAQVPFISDEELTQLVAAVVRDYATGDGT